MSNVLNHVIDFDAPPMIIHADWEVRESDQITTRLRGKWTFNQDRLSLYFSEKQKQEDIIVGKYLMGNLAGKKVMGAQLLDFYLANTHLIPEEWKDNKTFFWGTIYRDACTLCVRCLCWRGDRWNGFYRLLRFGFYSTDPALLAS